MSASFDTNLLVYATSRDIGPKNIRSTELVQRMLAIEAVISGQIVSEFLSVTHRKKAITPERGRAIVSTLASVLTLSEPMFDDRLMASHLAETRQIQFYDALLISTLGRSGVNILLSEDLTDGDTYGGVTILNPFNPTNAARIEAALS